MNLELHHKSHHHIITSSLSNTVHYVAEKEGKAVHLGYAEKCALVGLTQQVTHGSFDPSSSPPVGVLDVVGKDRR